jgi:Fe-S-cluster containining protein
MEIEYPRGLRHRCLRCTACCRDTPKRERRVLLTESEAASIASRTGLKTDQFTERVEGTEPYTREMKKAQGTCVFLREKGCLIYTSRPLVCRFFPLYLEKRSGDRFVFGVSEECPGVGKGWLLDRRFFYNLFHQAMISRGETTLPV